MLPETGPVDVFAQDKQVAFGDADGLQGRQAVFHQGPAESLPAVFRVHRQVVEISPPAIVPAEHGRHHPHLVDGHVTQAGVAEQVVADIVPGVGLTQADALAGAPQGGHLVVVFHGHGLDLEFHGDSSGFCGCGPMQGASS